MINLDDPSEYEDPVSQRAMAFCHVAKLADTVQNETMLRPGTLLRFWSGKRVKRRAGLTLHDLHQERPRGLVRSAIVFMQLLAAQDVAEFNAIRFYRRHRL